MKMLDLLARRRRILNVDESWMSHSTYYRKIWAPKDEACSVPMQTVSPRLSVIAAIDTDGRVWFSLSHSNTDSHTTALFLQHLVDRLNVETPGW